MAQSISASISSQQALNSMVRDLTSSKQKLKIITVITAIGLMFAIFSIGGSAYGIYYDMLLDYGTEVSVIVGALVGLTIEAVKMIGVWGFFAFRQLHLKLIFFGLLSLFTSFAIQLHYIGATNMELTKRVQVITEIQKRNNALVEEENARKNKIVELMGGVLQNGTSRDDKLAAKTLAKIDAKERSLFSQGKISQLDHEQIETVKEAARKRGNSMRRLLPLLEIFSIFGFLGAYLKTQSVNGGTKEVIEIVNTHVEKEGAKAYANSIINEVEAEEVTAVRAMLGNKSSPPATSVERLPLVPQETIAEIVDDCVSDEPKQIPHQRLIEDFKSSIENQKPHNFLEDEKPKTQKELPHQGVIDDFKQIADEANEIPGTKTKRVRALDYSNLDFENQLCIKLMFRYGEVEVGDELMLQKDVIKKLKERKIPRVDRLVSIIYGKLKDDGYIAPEGQNNRYIAKAELPKVFWLEKE